MGLKFILVFILASILLPNNTFAQEKPQVLIVNQVRGEECCDRGNLNNLKLQIDTSISSNIPATFVLRHDAINNFKYSNYLDEKSKQFPEIIKLGLLFEITPGLASASGVLYRGTEEDWFGAQNIFSIGYTEDEEKKIADKLFSEFKEKFGQYPELSSSWMIKTSLLNYISEKYGVKIHQITREQWGTDSYTLDGGPVHYPYPASQNWLFIPDYQRQNSPLIVRQTIDDPLFNYGDKTSSFTSQPNDYKKNKNFDYFKSILNQALFEQKNTGFALLGLENSMGLEFQNEFIKQLELVKSYKKDNKIIFPNFKQLSNTWKTNKIGIYQGRDIVGGKPNYAFWINTPNYRIRLRIENEKVFISDFRIFDTKFIDPYKDSKAIREGFWINPFLINGAIDKKTNNNSFIFSQPMPTNNFIKISHDTSTYGSKIFLPDITKKLQVLKSDKDLIIKYENANRTIKLSFNNDKIDINGVQAKEFKYIGNSLQLYPIKYTKRSNGLNLSWITNNKSLIELDVLCKDSCELKIKSNPNLLDSARKIDYEYLLPDPANHNLDSEKTVFYANNKYTIAGRTPVRVIIIPYDKYGIVTSFSTNTKIESQSKLKIEKFQQGKRYFYDFYSSTPISETVKMNFGGKEKQIKAYFAPNCKKEIKACISNPKYLWWYVNAIFGDKIRQIIYKEKQ